MIDSRKKQNPAKVWLSGYRSLIRQRDSISAHIRRDYDRATQATSRINAERVSGTSSHDSMANAVCAAVDAETTLSDCLKRLDAEIALIISAVESIRDAGEREIITMRYIAGDSWGAIIQRIGISERLVFMRHGHALCALNAFMRSRGIGE